MVAGQWSELDGLGIGGLESFAGGGELFYTTRYRIEIKCVRGRRAAKFREPLRLAHEALSGEIPCKCSDKA